MKPVYVFLETNLDITTGLYIDNRGYACSDEKFLDSDGVYVDIDKHKECLLFAKTRPERMRNCPENIFPVGNLRMFLLNGVEW